MTIPTFDELVALEARHLMALVPGVDAALGTIDVLLRRRLFDRAGAGPTVRMKRTARRSMPPSVQTARRSR